MSESKWLREIEEREKNATPGPWRWTENGYHGLIACQGDVIDVDRDGELYIHNPADAEFIARARADVPRSLAHVRELRGALASAVRCADADCDACDIDESCDGPVARVDALLNRQEPPEA